MAPTAPGDDEASDLLLRTISADGGITVRTLEATALVGEAAVRHETGPLGTIALGRVLMGAILLGAGGGPGETLQLRFRGTGPLGTLLAIADAEGAVRGYVSQPQAGVVGQDVPQAVGLGELAVVRHKPGRTRPYTGIVPIVHGTIAEDLALYLTESEQTPSAVALGVQLDERGRVAAAGGFLAQALPGAEEETLDRLEANVAGLPAPSSFIAEGRGAEGMAQELLEGLGAQVLESRPARFQCGCSRDRVVHAVALLGEEEVTALRTARETIEVRCEFCAERYEIDPGEVPTKSELSSGGR